MSLADLYFYFKKKIICNSNNNIVFPNEFIYDLNAADYNNYGISA